MKSRFFLLLLLSWLLAYPAPAQTPVADSLRQLLAAQAPADTTRVRRLQALAAELAVAQLPEAIRLTKQALQLAQRLSDATGEPLALLWLSNLYRRQADYQSARLYAQQALQLALRRADRHEQAKAYLQLSLIDSQQGHFAPAMTAALRGMQFAEQAHDLRLQTRLQATLGGIYSQLGDYTQAVPVLKQTLQNGQKLGDQQVISAALNGLGIIYQIEMKWPLAIGYYQRAIALCRKLHDAQNEAVNEVNLAEVYGQQGSYAPALAHGQRARALIRANHDDYTLPAVELALARAYLLEHRSDSAVALAGAAFRRSQQTHSTENLRNASDLLAQAYAQRNDFAQAYRYQRLFVAYKDTLSGEETQRKTTALRYGYELDKQHAKIALLTKNRQLQEQKAARQRQQLYALLAGLGGVVLLAGLLLRNIFLKQRANRLLNERNAQIAAQRDNLDRALTELKTAQTHLVQREKLASLGEVVAGVAHEIQNPLNFVTNFSELNVELVTELQEELAGEALSTAGKKNIDLLLDSLAQNQQKIYQHGRRADTIVKGMLEHSRTHTGQPQRTDLNALADEYLRLAYHGMRAKDHRFTPTLTTHFDPEVGSIELVPQEVGRVLLNLFTNAFYSVQKKAAVAGPHYQPEVQVHTQMLEKSVEIRVRDNGAGIPPAAVHKIFQPFFTTKPPGEGTGLGLSLSYDIITKGHGGTLTVNTQEGEFAEFVVTLPRVPVPLAQVA